MIEKPLVTICTVCYNAEDVIAQCMQSVVNQSFDDYEHLIIDGYSSDTTLEIVHTFAEQHSGYSEKVGVYSEPDTGIYNAMNKGVKKARGAYILFLNADDCLEFGALEKIALYLSAQRSNRVCYFGSLNIAHISGRMSIADPHQTQTRRMPQSMPIGHQAQLYPTDFLRSLGGFDENFSLAADYELYLRSLAAGAKWEKINVVVATYAQGGASFDLLETARQYRRVRIHHGMNPLKAWMLFVKNILAARLVRTLG